MYVPGADLPIAKVDLEADIDTASFVQAVAAGRHPTARPKTPWQPGTRLQLSAHTPTSRPAAPRTITLFPAGPGAGQTNEQRGPRADAGGPPCARPATGLLA